jgi:2-oxoglutarate ferredoxin oxidoreductase subunit delta
MALPAPSRQLAKNPLTFTVRNALIRNLMALLQSSGDEEMVKARIVIDRELCKECHLCILACKKALIAATTELNSRGYHPVACSENEDCTGCTLCAISCPEVAIEVYRER